MAIGITSMAYYSGFSQSVVGDRNALNILLGSYRVDEDFEKGPISGNGAIGDGGLLSATNDWAGAGLNLIVSGVTIESTGTGGNYSLEWDGNGAGPGSTKTLTAGVGMKLDFWNPTKAFGIDLKDYPTTRTVLTAGITVYGADDTTVLYNGTLDMTNPSGGTFFGYEFTNGIGSVVFSDAVTGPFWNNMSPFIDNLSFSTEAVPEPSTISLALIGFGIIAFRFVRRP